MASRAPSRQNGYWLLSRFCRDNPVLFVVSFEIKCWQDQLDAQSKRNRDKFVRCSHSHQHTASYMCMFNMCFLLTSTISPDCQRQQTDRRQRRADPVLASGFSARHNIIFRSRQRIKMCNRPATGQNIPVIIGDTFSFAVDRWLHSGRHGMHADQFDDHADQKFLQRRTPLWGVPRKDPGEKIQRAKLQHNDSNVSFVNLSF